MTSKKVKNKNQKKEATINDLAVVINNLSERMDKGFSGVNDRFTKIDRQFSGVNDRFKEQEIKFEKMMDDKVEELALMINRSFETLATKNEINSLKEEMNEKFDKVNNSIEKMSIHMDNLADTVYADHRPRIIDLENRTHKLESKI